MNFHEIILIFLSKKVGSFDNNKNNINVERRAKITQIFFNNNVMVIGLSGI